MNIRDNRGYMLVEIVLATAIAFGLAYFMTSLTIKIKNKSDDTLVMAQVATDQAIITNGFMKYAILEKDEFDCNEIDIDGNAIKYKDNSIDIVSDYTSLGEYTCSNKDGAIAIKIPLEVEQLKDKDYNVNINYKCLISDIAGPQLIVSNDGVKAIFKLVDNEGIKVGTYTIRYEQGEDINSCDLLGNSFAFVSNGEKELTKEIELTSSEKLHVCNVEDIPDINGNILSFGAIQTYEIIK